MHPFSHATNTIVQEMTSQSLQIALQVPPPPFSSATLGAGSRTLRLRTTFPSGLCRSVTTDRTIPTIYNSVQSYLSLSRRPQSAIAYWLEHRHHRTRAVLHGQSRSLYNYHSSCLSKGKAIGAQMPPSQHYFFLSFRACHAGLKNERSIPPPHSFSYTYEMACCCERETFLKNATWMNATQSDVTAERRSLQTIENKEIRLP